MVVAAAVRRVRRSARLQLSYDNGAGGCAAFHTRLVGLLGWVWLRPNPRTDRGLRRRLCKKKQYLVTKMGGGPWEGGGSQVFCGPSKVDREMTKV